LNGPAVRFTVLQRHARSKRGAIQIEKEQELNILQTVVSALRTQLEK
jgi:hypothetical protein